MHTNRISKVILSMVFAIMAFSLYSCESALDLLDVSGPKKDEYSMQNMLGAWTLGGDAPDSLVVFEFEKSEVAIGISALDGKGQFKNYPGRKDHDFTWNYENYDPLRLNIVGKEHQFSTTAAIKVIDKNHMLIRLSDDIAQLSGPELFTQDTYKFTRLKNSDK